MSAMSALHSDLAQIVTSDIGLVSVFSSKEASFRWGMLSAIDGLMALINVQAESNPEVSLDQLLFAHQTLLDMYDLTKASAV